MEKEVEINIKTTYFTQGTISEKTENIWFVCHGYGQLTKHFIRRFDLLDPITDFLIAPQGLSKFYLDNNYGHVGASWMTKENRELEIENQWSYFNSIFECETQNIDLEKVNINLFGFSQGVSTIWRWAEKRKLPFHKLVMWAGEFPREFTKEQLEFVPVEATLFLVIGKKDQYFNPERQQYVVNKMTNLCKKPEEIIFDGKHEVKREVLKLVL
ncbi:MAG: hypothetical protein KTR26_10020 [Flammeovirgaceae bacterium]|nr:hypothetical protein [Flammeovirgaceae bacterium]